MRLIDADELIEVFAEKKEVWRGNGVLPSNESLMWLAAMDITSNAPTVDAASVVHGKWLPDDEEYQSGWVCNQCYGKSCRSHCYCPIAAQRWIWRNSSMISAWWLLLIIPACVTLGVWIAALMAAGRD